MSVPNRNGHHRKSSARCDYAGQILLVLHFVFSRDNSVFFFSFQISPYVSYVYRVFCNSLASSSLSTVSFSATVSTTSQFGEEEAPSEAVCEEREQGSSGDESDERDSRSSGNGVSDDEQMQQVCVKFILSFLRNSRSFLSPFPGCLSGVFS